MDRQRKILVAAAVGVALLVAAVIAFAAGGDDDEGEVGTGSTTSTSSAETTTTSTAGDTAPPSSAPTPDPRLEDVAVTLTPVAELEQPVAASIRPGTDELYVADRVGEVWRFVDDELDGPLLDLTDDTESRGEQGLLGLAFAPSGGHLYVNYTDLDGDTHVDELAVGDDGAIDAGSRREVLTVDQPYPNHNGGHLVFGPDDLLYVGLGDGGSSGDPDENGQDPSTLLGSILRIDPTGGDPYAVPGDNPFVGGGGAPEVFVWGVRNPWRFSFDDNGDLWIADVGQNAWEEVTRLPAGQQAGANLEWNLREGTHEFEGGSPPGGVGPVFEYENRGGRCSITGGVVYRGAAIPDLVGSYLFSDYCSGVVHALALDGAGAVRLERSLDVEGGPIVHFQEGPDGEVYVFSLDGRILRLDPS